MRVARKNFRAALLLVRIQITSHFVFQAGEGGRHLDKFEYVTWIV
jgi:hypothetical protein